MNPSAIPAEYVESPLAAYRGNPFIEALPSYSDDREVWQALVRNPVYDPDERRAPASLRRQAIMGLQNLFFPLPQHIELAWTITRTIRQGYTRRNPADDKYLAGIRQSRVRLTSQMKNWNTAAEPPPGLSVIGVSGIGKSTAINAILNLMPQVITHTEYQGRPMTTKQVTWIKVDLPFDASVKGLVAKFLAKADNLLGTEFGRMVLSSRATVDMLMPDMATAASMCGLGLLVIDEIQHLQAAKSGGAAKMLNFFVELSNTMGVPVVLVGTPQALEPLGSEFRSARRACGQGSVYWDRMREADPAFKAFLKKVWQYQYTTEETPLSDEIVSCLYHETQGITHLLIILYLLAQDAMIGSGGGERITPEMIAATAKKCLRPIAPFLDALRGGESAASLKDMEFRLDVNQLREAPESSITIQQRRPPVPSARLPAEEKPQSGKTKGRKPKSLFAQAAKNGVDPHALLKERGIARGLDDLMVGKGAA